MDNPSVPRDRAFPAPPFVGHLALLPSPPPAWRCGLCAQREEPAEDARCERCGAMLHWRCYWPAALAEPEGTAAEAAIDEANAAQSRLLVEIRLGPHAIRVPVRTESLAADGVLDRLLILCPGCRS